MDLTIHTVTGDLSVQDVCDELDYYYSGHFTMLILWDVTRADLSSWQKDDIIYLARKVKKYSHLRRDGKTAIVLLRDVDFGISRMYQTYADVEKIDFEINVFRDVNEAKQWLGVPITSGE